VQHFNPLRTSSFAQQQFLPPRHFVYKEKVVEICAVHVRQFDYFQNNVWNIFQLSSLSRKRCRAIQQRSIKSAKISIIWGKKQSDVANGTEWRLN